MSISPCNNLNVKTIRFSQLAYLGFNDLKGSDIIYISQFDPANNLYYSKKTTLTDLANFAKLANSSSYSGSFSGSFSGKLISKNSSLTGSFSGSHYGKVVSKNTIASGSFSGSFYGSLESKNTKASGSFSGSFYGNATTATNALTADLATTATTATTATSATSATTSLTSSYLLKTPTNTSTRLSYWDNTRLTSSLLTYYKTGATEYGLQLIGKSLSTTPLKAAIDIVGTAESFVALTTTNVNRPGFWSNGYPNQDTWYLAMAESGSLRLSVASGSYQLNSSPTFRFGSKNNEVIGLLQRRNNFYFWPYMGNQAAARDGAVGIGVFPPNSPTGSFDKYLRAKLQIVMFSGSNEGTFPGGCSGVEHRSTAILVQYGSGSATTGYAKTFHVSASGNTYVGGTLTVGSKITSSLTVGSLPTGAKTFANDGTSRFLPISVGGTTYYLPLYT